MSQLSNPIRDWVSEAEQKRRYNDRTFFHEIRVRFNAALLCGSSILAAAKRYEIAMSTVVLWWKRYFRGTCLEALSMDGDSHCHRSRLHSGMVPSWFKVQTDITIDEIFKQLAEPRHCSARNCVWALLAHEDHKQKIRTDNTREQKGDDVHTMRPASIDAQYAMSQKNLLFLDECNLVAKLTHSHVWSKRGKPCNSSKPHGRCNNTMLIAMSILKGIMAPLILNNPMDKKTFRDQIDKVLVKELRVEDIAIYDNLPVHKLADVCEIPETIGTKPPFLPSYSPYLDPIEKTFLQVKFFLRKFATRTRADLDAAIGKTFGFITSQNACNFFVSEGFCGESA